MGSALTILQLIITGTQKCFFQLGEKFCPPNLRIVHGTAAYLCITTRPVSFLRPGEGGDAPIGGGLELGMKHRESPVPEVRAATSWRLNSSTSKYFPQYPQYDYSCGHILSPTNQRPRPDVLAQAAQGSTVKAPSSQAPDLIRHPCFTSRHSMRCVRIPCSPSLVSLGEELEPPIPSLPSCP